MGDAHDSRLTQKPTLPSYVVQPTFTCLSRFSLTGGMGSRSGAAPANGAVKRKRLRCYCGWRVSLMTADTSPDGPYQRGCSGAGRSSGKQTDGPGSTRADNGTPARPEWMLTGARQSVLEGADPDPDWVGWFHFHFHTGAFTFSHGCSIALHSRGD